MKRTLVLIVVLAAAALLCWRLAPRAHPQQVAADSDDDVPIAASSRVVMRAGVAVITLDAKTRAAVGIRVARLAPAAAPPQVSAPATVLSLTPLVTARAQLIAAQAALAKAQTALAVAEQEDTRLQHLYGQQQNASAKQVEAADGVVRADQADLRAAQQSANLDLAAVRLDWGDTVAAWMQHDAPPLADLLARRSLLVQVTLQSDQPVALAPHPAHVEIEVPGAAHRAAATFVSNDPRADPRLQGSSLLYLAPAQPGLATGLNLTAWLPRGRPAPGVLVPDAAVVWWQGAPWAYESTSPSTFVRRPVPAGRPLPGGLFAASGFRHGEQVVVAGAAALLSEELRAQIQPED